VSRIPWAQPYIGDEEIEAVSALLRERRISMGPQVQALEAELAALAGRRHGVAVANGTVALDVALRVAGVGPGDRVLVSALSYIATVSSIVLRGATPVFCDVDARTLNIDAAAVAAHADGARALLVADYCGSPVDYGALEPACERHGVELLVDGAQSLGSLYAGTPTLARGLVSTTSLHTAKSFITGEGGMVFLDDDELATLARRIRGQGEIPGRKYVHDTLASNYRMTDYAAAIGRVQIGRFEAVNARRRELTARYDAAFAPNPGIEVAAHHAGGSPSRFSYAVLVEERDRVAAELAEAGIETRSLYPMPAYRQPIPEYAPFAGAVCPVAERAAGRVLNLPLFYEMTDAQADRVCEALAQAVGR
jgi:dTDP-4-amino-4,6-dideoxygalactose transaminase